VSKVALASLAILNVNRQANKDYIDNFVPFAIEATSTLPASAISITDLQPKILELFGLNIPQGALQTILHRATREGFLSRKGGVFTRNKPAISKLAFGKIKGQILRTHEAAIARLVHSGFGRKRPANPSCGWALSRGSLCRCGLHFRVFGEGP
jgi:hypothetical protein